MALVHILLARYAIVVDAALGQADENLYLGMINQAFYRVDCCDPLQHLISLFHSLLLSRICVLDNFNAMQQETYSVAAADLPLSMDDCKNSGQISTQRVIVSSTSGIVTASQVVAQCGIDSTCIVPFGTTLRMVGANLNLGALIVQGAVEWFDDLPAEQRSTFLCSGYVAVENNGLFQMDVQKGNAYIYIKDNGALHPDLRTRAFGGVAKSTGGDYPIIDITGREMKRTWSLLSKPIAVGDQQMTLMHDAHLMNW